ncbi:hypothetical protein [Sphingomonas sp. BE137]|uniref:hypothetical protein n=1 Tax=Sphingomonas sp. BE137 TaxID=2817844 RepID=UPI001AE62D2D|nr:hypothetical protein [Sphingomonas sp. BE137]MDR6847184.1 hypothetical protein [Sphingomonas sp. BE137]
MPQEQIYQPQVAPGNTAGIPLAQPQDFGAGVGQGIEQLGGALHRGAIDAYKIERQQRADAQAADFNVRFAQAREDADKASIDARTNAAPGGAGHADQMAQWWADRKATLTDGITEDSLRRSASAQINEFGSRFETAEYQFEAGARVGKIATDTQSATEIAANRAYRQQDPKAFGEEFSLGRQSLENMTGVPAEVRQKLIKDYEEKVSVGFLNGVKDRNPSAVKLLLDSGGFDDLVSPQQMERLRDGAQVEIRRNEALAQHQIALQKAATNEAIATAKAQQAAGIVVPDATLDQLAQAARANGDTSNATELSALQIHNGVNRETQGWTAQQYDSELARLRALGPKASPDDQVRLHALETIAPGRKQQFERDPGQWAAINGAPPPPLNFADPATWAARRQWAATVSKAAGQPVPLLQPAEVNQLKANFASGDKGRLEVIDTIAPLGGRDALQAMRQIAPDDAVAQRLVGLPMINRASAASGAAARKADRSLIDDMKPDGSGKLALEKYNTDVAPALARFAPQDANAAREIAGNLYADWARAHGVHTFNPSQYGTFLQVAVGGAIDGQGVFHGGIGYWNNVPVKLPAEQSQAQFEKVLSSVKWSDDPKVPHPVYSDGKTTITPQVLRSYVPVARSDGFYEFHGPGGIIVASNTGGIFKLDLGYLGRKYLK